MSNIERANQPSFQIDSLNDAMRFAQAIASAEIVPPDFQKNPANILVALEISKALGESVWVVMSEMSIVHGRPSFSAKFMRSRVRQAGHRLRESYDPETETARAVIVRADDPDYEHVAEWDMEKVRQHNLGHKGHWMKNKQLMQKNRALSEVVREACYEVLGGVPYTPDEVRDFQPSQVRQEARRTDEPKPVEASEPRPYWWSETDQRDRNTYVANFTDSILAAESAGDREKIEKMIAYVTRHGDGELVQMAQQVVSRMPDAAELEPQAEHQDPADMNIDGAEVFEAELVR